MTQTNKPWGSDPFELGRDGDNFVGKGGKPRASGKSWISEGPSSAARPGTAKVEKMMNKLSIGGATPANPVT